MPVRVQTWLLNNLGTGDHMRAFNTSTGSPAPPPVITFHLLAESGDTLVTESGGSLTIE